MNRFTAYFRHHARFYAAAAAGLAVFAAGAALGWPAPLLAGGDVFFLVFLILAFLLARESASELAARADSADEGMTIVFLVTLGAMAFFCEAVFVALNKKH